MSEPGGPRQAEIPEPAAHRGEIPSPRKHQGPPLIPFPWAKHRELAKAMPPVAEPGTTKLRGGWVLVGEAKRRGDGPKERRRQIWNLKSRLNRFLDTRWPLERWQITVVIADGTDRDYQCWFRYLGELTPEQDVQDRKERRARYEATVQRRLEVKAQRALESRRSGGAAG